MTRLRIILWTLMLLLGFLWDFLPILPWPFLSYLAIIFLQIADKKYFTIGQIIILWIIMVIVTAIDVITPIIWTKKMWWTKRWTRWSTIWLIVWVIVLPIFWIVIWPFWLFWLLWWPFLWAYIGEILYQKKKCAPLSKGAPRRGGDLKSSVTSDKSESPAPLNKGVKKTEWQTLNHDKALKAAFWSFLWFLWWILLKVVYTIIIAIYFFPAMIQII